MKNYYEILEVTSSATTDQIRSKWIILIQAWHPDKFRNHEQKSYAENKSKDINEAYQTLSNPQKREEYDRLLNSFGAQDDPFNGFSRDKNENRTQYGDEEQARQQKKQAEKEAREEKIKEAHEKGEDVVFYVQSLINEYKWKLALKELYLFDDLGIPPSEEGESTFDYRCSRDHPKWQKASSLDTEARNQKSNFTWGLIIASFCLFLITLAVILADAGTDSGAGLIIFGGSLIGPIGGAIYAHKWAGKKGLQTDILLGIGTCIGFLILVLISFYLIFCVVAIIVLGLIFGAG